MNWFLAEFVSPPLQGRLFRGQLSKNTFMTKVGPGTSPATSGQISGQVGGQVGGQVNGEAGAKPVSVKLDIQHDATNLRLNLKTVSSLVSSFMCHTSIPVVGMEPANHLDALVFPAQ